MPEDAPRITTKEELAVFVATVLPGLFLDDYPYLLEHSELRLRDGSHKEEGEFEFGLKLILDGLTRVCGTT